MASFIIAAAILSILSEVAFFTPPLTREKRMEMVNAAAGQVGNGESIKNFVQSKMIPGRFKMN